MHRDAGWSSAGRRLARSWRGLGCMFPLEPVSRSSAHIPTDAIKYLYFNSPLPPSWSLRDLRFDAATLRSFRFRGLYDATDPTCRASGARPN